MKKRVLGRGLDVLIPELSKAKGESYSDIDIDLITPNSYQPRLRIKEEGLQELVASIREHGVVQPILVRRLGTGFQLVAGERRWRAAQMAGLTKIPAVVREIEDERMLELALIENIQREDLNPVEEAQAYQNLIEHLHLNQEQVAKRVGKERSSITNALRLLKLPESIQKFITEGKLTSGHAKALLSLESEAEQMRLAEKIIADGLSVREIEDLTRRPSRKDNMRPPSPERDPNEVHAEDKLRLHLGTNVKIRRSGRGGRIEIDFYSQEDLQRIYSLIIGGETTQAGAQAV